MIAHLRGTLIEKHPNEVILECSGVGYALTVPVSSFTALPELKQEASMHVYTAVREDAIVLYGFVTRDEKSLFERLITVSGIGPKLAVTILSGMAAPDLVVAIRTGDTARLVRIPGVGKKTAERMVLELKEKLQAFEGAMPAGTAVPTSTLSPIEADVLSALVNLGCAPPAAEAALAKAKGLGGDTSFEGLFRRSLEFVR
ncbi:MAG: Holliday junction branch migration protein RuvA [Bryobacterales bacterium]|nr:Holliday junction branch migration protein RuvA [Bryobacterales bacterium]